MRIIAGKWKSRRLSQPPTGLTRPFPDRVREAVFSMLGEYFDAPGGLPPIRVADVFAGSGSMGLEALSRGARFCWFFDNGPVAIKTLRKNIITLDAGTDTRIVVGDAWVKPLRLFESESADVVFLDPPYAETRDCDAASRTGVFLAGLADTAAAGATVIFHHPARTEVQEADLRPWRIHDRRRFGTNGITVLVESGHGETPES